MAEQLIEKPTFQALSGAFAEQTLPSHAESRRLDILYAMPRSFRWFHIMLEAKLLSFL
jgi:hypothetical protein